MRKHKFIVLTFLNLFVALSAQAEQWTTHFAYNNVTQIAMAKDKVYAISDGSLFSVDKLTEQITKYDRLSGLHGTGINCIHYDSIGNQLIIAYANGKIDILSSSGVKYLSELYDKDMTQRKDIYNVTIQGRMAYLSTHYGVQTLDLRENKLVNSYWLRPGGHETPIQDVRIIGDSIYAFLNKTADKSSNDSLFCASLHDNLVDYTYWYREKGNRITPDANKGKYDRDKTSEWYAGGSVGITRVTATETLHYKPDGPLSNIPYGLTAIKGQLWMVQGGRWASNYQRPGSVMHYNGTTWNNIPQKTIQTKTGNPSLDFMNVAVDLRNDHHYFIASHGTGLYEFDNDTLVRQYLPGPDNTLNAAVPSNPARYTNLNCVTYDEDNNLWLFSDVDYAQLQCMDTAGIWHAVDLRFNNDLIQLYTSAGLAIDATNSNLKWISTARYNTFVGLLDDNGTRFDATDDRIMCRSQWINQNSQPFKPNFIYAMIQDQQGRIWIGTDAGAAYIETGKDYFTSDAIVQPAVVDNNGENPITSLVVNAICQTENGEIWIGTQNLGIYVLNSSATEIVEHYTTENSAMPSNAIISLASDENGKVWIGTDAGLVEYDQQTTPTNGQNRPEDSDASMNLGTMQQWRLHLSYYNALEVAASPKHIYAVADGSLFSVARSDETTEYWSRATGLNGNTVAHIAYDVTSGYLIITYEDGRIDLIDDAGKVQQMPDLYMKAGSIPVSVNSIAIGSRNVYLAMPFGIVAINPKKGEVIDTYYIGPEASSVDILRVVEKGDSLYAFTADYIYRAALSDNLADYSYWHLSPLTVSQLQNAVVHKDKIYTLQHDSLYRQEGNTWHLISPQPIKWIHASNGHLLLHIENQGLYQLTNDEQLEALYSTYAINDAIYSSGEYWLAQPNYGLIRLNSAGNDYYPTSGPNSNFGYFMCSAHGKIYSSIGGRWASQFQRYGRINIYDGHDWLRIDASDIGVRVDQTAIDIVSLAVDPNDAGHFFAATYGTGVYEFKDYAAATHYTPDNSTLREVVIDAEKRYYTRTDGAMIDNDGNLWVMNTTTIGQPLHVRTPNGVWHSLVLHSGDNDIQFITPKGIWVDRRKDQHKWMMDQRSNPRIVLLDDRGTPTNNNDDKCMARSTFIDQNGNTLTPSFFYSFAQDHTNRIWIGTEKGIITIPASVDFFTSNACKRIIIPRNDGTGLGDYLLGDEQINCMAVDGGNRMWIGTANSGLYLIEDDTITVAHFTETNSLLPSNSISSITIMPETGEVFVGTDRGIASYKSDASEPREDLNHAYAYPNPVRPNYVGMITITGLMENTVVNIIDSGGNLLCKTKSNGGTAVWDGRDAYGRRATAGVYTAFCNEPNGGHNVVKILIMR